MQRIRRFVHAVRRHWLRLVLGALGGIAAVFAALFLLLLYAEWRHAGYSDLDLATGEAWLLMVAPVGGALVAYAGRR